MTTESPSPAGTPKVGRKETLGRASDSGAAEDKKERRFSAAKPSKRASTTTIGRKNKDDMPDEMQL